MTDAYSGRPIESVTLESVRQGDISPDDLRIHPSTLEHQAQVAQDHGNPQLAANLRRAGELANLPDGEVMAVYEALRPRRSTYDGLSAIADRLASTGCPLNAALIREARDVYLRRGLLHP